MSGKAVPDRKDQRKDVSRAGAAGFAVVVGLWLISVAFVWLPIAWLVNNWASGAEELTEIFYLVAVALVVPWTAVGLLLLTDRADESFWQKKNDCRVPTGVEWTRLEPLWNDVCERARLHPDAYRLRMTDRSTINAFASGDSVVSMDQGMLGMDDGAIAAVMAHELGHHTKRHIGGIVLGWWFAKPAQFLLNLMLWILAGMVGVGRGCSGCIGALILISFIAILVIPTVVLYALLGLSTVLLRVLGRKTEFEADRYAVDLGLGRDLASALRQLEAMEPDAEVGRFSVDRLMSTHPPLKDRIARLKTELP